MAQDKKQAVHWYTKAAEQGDADAQQNLSVMYARGEGVARDAAKSTLLGRARRASLTQGLGHTNLTRIPPVGSARRQHEAADVLSHGRKLGRDGPRVCDPELHSHSSTM